jgi:hypothetical protein
MSYHNERLDSRAVALAESWMKGNRKDVARALRRNGRLAIRVVEKLRGMLPPPQWLAAQSSLCALMSALGDTTNE